MAKKEIKKIDKKKVEKNDEPIITDILEEDFRENGERKTRKIYMSGNKKIKEEVVNS